VKSRPVHVKGLASRRGPSSTIARVLSVDDGWLAGIIEGEGVIELQRRAGRGPRARIRVKMVDEDVIARLSKLWGAGYRERPPRLPHHQPIFETEISGRRAEELLSRLRPLFGTRRGAKIDEVLAGASRSHDRVLVR
jgi:hypothetical protein